MGTSARLSVRGPGAGEAGPGMAAAARLALESVEAETSAFRATSAVARVSAAAGSGEWIATGPAFDAALDAALDAARWSGGAFNPLVAPLVEANGFPRRPPGSVPPAGSVPADPAAVLDLSGIERRPGACRLSGRGMALDLGGVAKGVGVDFAAAAARAAATNDFLLDVGGGLAGRGEWTVGIRDPRGTPEDPPLRTFVLPDGTAVATSGNYERFSESPDGTRIGHVVDPRSGLPVSGPVLQATAVAPSAAAADAWSTAFFVLGPEEGRAAAKRRGGVAGLWVEAAPEGGISVKDSR